MKTVLLSEWLVISAALMHSSQVTFAFHTVCFLTVHATLISILINAQKKCRGNCWSVKANIQTSWPWSHGEFASAVPWDLIWHLIPQQYRHLRHSPVAWPWWAMSQCGCCPMCPHIPRPQPITAPEAVEGSLRSSGGHGGEGADSPYSSINCSLAVCG